MRAVMCRSIGASAWGSQRRPGGSGGPRGFVRCPPIRSREGPTGRLHDRVIGDFRKSASAQVLFFTQPRAHDLQRRNTNVDVQTSWRGGRAVELVRNAGVSPGSGPGAGLLRFLLSQRKLPKIKGHAIPMAIMSNPPPNGMIGRVVKPSAWCRSERASTDPALTAALTRCGTESGPPGMKRGGMPSEKQDT